MNLDFLTAVFEEHKRQPAIIWQENIITYQELLDRTAKWDEQVPDLVQARTGRVVVLEADFTPSTIALLLSLIKANHIIIPLLPANPKKNEYLETALPEVLIRVRPDQKVQVSHIPSATSHPLYEELKKRQHPGLVLFSSGSTGKCKAAVHDFLPLLEKFKTRRNPFRTIIFLLYDHIGGINTLFHTLANGGCLITVAERTPENVLRLVEEFQAELLPASPTFLNLMLISGAIERYNLQSLKLITYGTEPMPESTLHTLHRLLPEVKLQQTYGLSELGIMHSKSESSDSQWVKIGGDGFTTRIVDGILQIKAASAMLGYLNAPSPFTGDEYFITGDMVEVKGEYLRILGRKSELINVGGQKVFPVEVENVIRQCTNVKDVLVFGEKNLLMGQIVCAKVQLVTAEATQPFIIRLKKFCMEKLEDYKVPVRVTITNEDIHTDRFKKNRAQGL